MMDLRFLMESFRMDEGLRDDLSYCQKNFRNIISIYSTLQTCLDKVVNSDMDIIDKGEKITNKIKALKMLLIDVDTEQAKLKSKLIEARESFIIDLKNKFNNLEIDYDVVNGYITKVLSIHYDQNYASLAPRNVKQWPTYREMIDLFVLNEKPATHVFPSHVIAVEHDNEYVAEKEIQTEKLKRPSKLVEIKNDVKKLMPTHKKVEMKEKVKPAPEIRTVSTEVKVPVTEAMIEKRMNLRFVLINLRNNFNNKNTESDEETAKKLKPMKKTVISEMKRKSAIRSSICSTSSDQSSNPPTIGLPPKTRKRRSPGNSGDSDSNECDFMKNVQLPPELPEPEINDQESFMRVLGLFTHDICNTLKQKKKERKRRNVKCTERNDFHYGAINLDEYNRTTTRRMEIQTGSKRRKIGNSATTVQILADSKLNRKVPKIPIKPKFEFVNV